MKPIKSTPLMVNNSDNDDNVYLVDNITGQETITEDLMYVERLKDWDNKNYQTITWLGNTSILVIHTQFDASILQKHFGIFYPKFSIYWLFSLLSTTLSTCYSQPIG